MPQYDAVIIGGGISGLSALHYLRRLNPTMSVRLFEADNRLGGTIGTDHIDGYSLDWGPNGFLDREPLTLELCDELGLTDSLERANPSVQKRFIVRDSKLREIPLSPVRFMTSGVLSLPGRLRILIEPFTRPNRDTDDESIYSFAKRHMGTQAADYLIQPMVSGIYGGIADRLSLASCFPIMREMEAEHGSLIKAMIARKKKNKARGKSGGPSGPSGWLTSFHGGLYVLIERLEQLYRDDIVRSAAVAQVIKSVDGYEVVMQSGQRLSAKNVVMATPSFNAMDLVASLSPDLSKALSAIPYAPIAVVCLGFKKSDVWHPLDGFGFLVPQKENRTILGSIWTSSIFADRAPEGEVQLRTMVGGDGDHASAALPDDQLFDIVHADLKGILGRLGKPTMKKIYRWQKGIPQYVIGHARTLSDIERELGHFAGLYVAGNAYHGIGLNDCVKQARAVADRITAPLSA